MYIDVDDTIAEEHNERGQNSSEPSGERFHVQAPKQPEDDEAKRSNKSESSTKPTTCPDCKKFILKAQFGVHRRWHCKGKKVKALS
jgi:hypothetical protein